MRLVKVESGKIYKPLPIIRSDGSKVNFIKVSFGFVNNAMLYDETNLFNRIWSKNRKNNIDSSGIGIKYFYSFYIDDEIVFASVGGAIMEILLSYDFDDLNNGNGLLVNSKMDAIYPSYKDSKIIPFNTNIGCFLSDDDRDEWIIKNQPDIDSWLKAKGVSSNIGILRHKFGDIMSEIVSEDRDVKLEKIFSENT